MPKPKFCFVTACFFVLQVASPVLHYQGKFDRSGEKDVARPPSCDFCYFVVNESKKLFHSRVLDSKEFKHSVSIFASIVAV